MSATDEALTILREFVQVQSILGQTDNAKFVQRAIDKLDAAKDEPVLARAGDWTVEHFTDESGVWVNLLILRPDDLEDDDVHKFAAAVLMSDVEASQLADSLMEPNRG